jgi:hypothetical protein
MQFALKEFLLFDDEEVAEMQIWTVILSSAMTNWPYCLDRSLLHTNTLIQGSPDYFFENCDSSSLKKITCLNKYAFKLLYKSFEPIWKQSSKYLGKMSMRALSG